MAVNQDKRGCHVGSFHSAASLSRSFTRKGGNMWKCQVIFIACEVTQGGAREERGRASKEEEAAAARHSFYIHGGDSGRGERSGNN